MLGKRGPEEAQGKNKTPAARQITAEQILREATDAPIRQKGPSSIEFRDEADLNQYRMIKRKEFEDILRNHRYKIPVWIKYAKWEESQNEFRRVRSIYERALQVDYQNVSIWLKYIEMEISHKFINHARALYDRVTSLLPKVDQLWFKYAYMEERLENYAGARAIYEKWMSWKPADNAWLQYIKFEDRCGETARARALYERCIEQEQSELSFIRYCKFEERMKEFVKARAAYDTCIHLLDPEKLTEDIFLRYAQFELRRGDIEKAKKVYRLGLTKLADYPERSKKLYDALIVFTKQTGSKSDIEELLIEKRRAHYERQLVEDSENLDVCFNYIRMEEEAGDVERVREVFERSIAKVPTKKDKKHWKRYIFIWLFYAQFEEAVAEDISRAREVYTTAVKVCELADVVFFKHFKNFAEFELRQLNVEGFRKCLLHALTVSRGSKKSISRFWIETELKLGNVNQARHVAAKCIELSGGSSQTWLAFIDLETALGEVNRAVALCDLAYQSKDSIDDIATIIRKQIELLASNPDVNLDQVRELYKGLIDVNNQDPNVYLDFSEFELTDGGSLDRACAVLEEALEILPESMKNERQQIRSKLTDIVQDRTGDDYDM
jgi:crooked neck